ncbi:uncharacterized protein LOC105701855 [Orussus abietinus]|uniref:uncharacterized protein LOC105701855 n=1 Tax=Orussus abietinus TaxID=222816 RepID=UPI00062647F9|nr:uncharacterized protein LOC105701855 [Orussus abietinus]
MRVASTLLAVISLLSLFDRSHTAPAQSSDKVLLGQVDIALPDEDVEFPTEEPFLKRCMVDGKSYSHSQAIPSFDSNSHCLCVAGEVYCWWQRYRLSTDLPPSHNWQVSTLSTDSNEVLPSNGSTVVVEDPGTSDEPEESSSEEAEIFEVNPTNSSGSSPMPTTCLVMGREYREGETLPHSTGNCVECSCGSEGRVECSPRDCVALRSQLTVDIADAADGDFEVFELNRDRGLDVTF